jgi:hypothetical protein
VLRSSAQFNSQLDSLPVSSCTCALVHARVGVGRAGRVTRNYTEAYVARRALFREETKRRMAHIAARKAKATPPSPISSLS